MTARRAGPTPLPHQEEGVRFLRERAAAALFDEQGLGKTKQLIDAVGADIATGTLAGALVICPNTLKSTWADELERHSTLRYAIFGAGRSARREAFRSLRAAFYVINYEAVASELPSLRALLRFKRMALVLDESHRIKTPTARVTKAVHALRAEAAKRYIMSGTPVANKPEDLWSQFFFLDDGVALGATFAEFRQRYGRQGSGYVNLSTLREQLASISLRREKLGTVALPPKSVRRIKVTLQSEQHRMYETMRNELAMWVQSLSGDEVLARADHILSRLVRLAQLASNPRLIDAAYVETPAKLIALDDILEVYLAQSSEKAIVWTSFVSHIPELLHRYARYRPVALHGQMSGETRDAAIAAFASSSDVRVLIANPAAAREGLTLTSGRYAIYLDRTFNLVDFLQSQDRIHRLSQTRPCELLLLVAENTIDEFVEFTLAQKHRLARYAQGDTDTIVPEDLLLQKPAVLQALLVPDH